MLPVLGIIRFLYFRHSNRCVRAFRFSINFIFCNEKLYLTAFHVLICQSCIFIYEVSHKTFMNSFFFNWVVYFLIFVNKEWFVSLGHKSFVRYMICIYIVPLVAWLLFYERHLTQSKHFHCAQVKYMVLYLL